MRGNAPYVSPDIASDMKKAFQDHLQLNADMKESFIQSFVPQVGSKTSILQTAVKPHLDSVEDAINFASRPKLLIQLQAIADGHGVDAGDNRAANEKAEYEQAVHALNEFEKAVKAVQSEKTTQTVQMARIKER